MDLVSLPVRSLKAAINSNFADKEPWQIVTITTSSVLASVWLWDFLCQDESKFDTTFLNYVNRSYLVVIFYYINNLSLRVS